MGRSPSTIGTLSPMALTEGGADAAVRLREILAGSACCWSGLAGRLTLQVGGNLSTLDDSCAN